MANLKDLADLLHAVAWPLVALTALIIFRRSLIDALRRIPLERTASFKVPGLGELKMTDNAEKLAEETVITAVAVPSRGQAAGEREN